MKLQIKTFTFDELSAVIEQNDDKYLFGSEKTPNPEELDKKLLDLLNPEEMSTITVLGIDIYQYSQYSAFPQNLVPLLFKKLFKESAERSINESQFVFQKYESFDDFLTAFIDTGDGGFLIFPSPIHAVTFAMYFQMSVQYYNSGHLYPRLNQIVGDIELRYTMTTDKIFGFEGNYYGPAIINNGRILSKDSLNRFLIDHNTYKWFENRMISIGSLKITGITELEEYPEFRGYKANADLIFPQGVLDYRKEGKIDSIEVQKIGQIQSKKDIMTVYNFKVVFIAGVREVSGTDNTMSMIALGNTNPDGIK